MFRFLPKINAMTRIILFFSFLTAAVIIVLAFYFTQMYIEPVDPFSEKIITLEIPSGASARKVAALLKEKELIHDELFQDICKAYEKVRFNPVR